MGRRTLALALIGGGILLGLAYATGKTSYPFALVVALLLFGAGGLLFPRTYEIADRMRPWLDTNVEAKAWGGALPGQEGAAFRFHRTLAVGAGLHFYFVPQHKDKTLHLKVAQPAGVVLSEHAMEIGTAKYVQWCGKKIKRTPGEKALVLQRTTQDSQDG